MNYFFGGRLCHTNLTMNFRHFGRLCEIM